MALRWPAQHSQGFRVWSRYWHHLAPPRVPGSQLYIHVHPMISLCHPMSWLVEPTVGACLGMAWPSQSPKVPRFQLPCPKQCSKLLVDIDGRKKNYPISWGWSKHCSSVMMIFEHSIEDAAAQKWSNSTWIRWCCKKRSHEKSQKLIPLIHHIVYIYIYIPYYVYIIWLTDHGSKSLGMLIGHRSRGPCFVYWSRVSKRVCCHSQREYMHI